MSRESGCCPGLVPQPPPLPSSPPRVPGHLHSPECAGHALCREHAALQHLCAAASAGCGPGWMHTPIHPSLCTAQTSHAVGRAAQRSAVTEKACVPLSWRGLPFRRQTAQRVCGWEGVFPNTASATTSFVLHSGCFCSTENYHHSFPSPPREKEHPAAEEAGCSHSHSQCYEQWHSSHKQPLKMLCEPHT